MSQHNKEFYLKALLADPRFHRLAQEEGMNIEISKYITGGYMITPTDKPDHFLIAVQAGNSRLFRSQIRVTDKGYEQLNSVDPKQVINTTTSMEDLLKSLGVQPISFQENRVLRHPKFREDRKEAEKELSLLPDGTYLLTTQNQWGQNENNKLVVLSKQGNENSEKPIQIGEKGPIYEPPPRSRYLRRVQRREIDRVDFGDGETLLDASPQLQRVGRAREEVPPSQPPVETKKEPEDPFNAILKEAEGPQELDKQEENKKLRAEFQTKTEENFKKIKSEILADPHFQNKVLSASEIELFFNKQFFGKEAYIISRSPLEDKYIISVQVPPAILHRTINARVTEDLQEVIKQTMEQLKSKVEGLRKNLESFMTAYDTKQAAADSEASMRTQPGDLGLMAAIRRKYFPKFNEIGEAKVLAEFQEYTKNQFLSAPPGFDSALLANKDDAELIKKAIEGKALTKEQQESELLKLFPNGFKLPLNPAPEFLNKFSEEGRNKILEQYYLDPFHTAWRYFLKPNPLIDPGASYAASTGNRHTHADITPQSRSDFAYLWLAASDPTIVPIRDMTTEQMKALFTEEIAHIGRGHNWDHLDKMSAGPEKNKYRSELIKKYGRVVDDLKPDNPSCASGVNGRLMQSVLGNPITEIPEARPLNLIVLRTLINDMIAKKFNEFLATKSSNQIEEMLRIHDLKNVTMDELSEKEQKIYDEFQVSQEDINNLIRELREYFGERLVWQQIESEGVTSYAEYIRKQASQDPWLIAYERMKNIADHQIEHLKQVESKKFKEEKFGKAVDAEKRAAQQGLQSQESKEGLTKPAQGLMKPKLGEKIPSVIFSMNLESKEQSQPEGLKGLPKSKDKSKPSTPSAQSEPGPSRPHKENPNKPKTKK